MVTPSELTFDRGSIDFGPCTTHESVATLHMTNTSLLAQSFGFLSLPAFVDVQPGDGLGEILPQETLAVDLVFSARKPREYSFELTIKTVAQHNRSYNFIASLLYGTPTTHPSSGGYNITMGYNPWYG